MIHSTKSPHVYFYTADDISATKQASWRGLTREGWYFWDETEAYAYGPYESEEVAEMKLNDYVKTLG